MSRSSTAAVRPFPSRPRSRRRSSGRCARSSSRCRRCYFSARLQHVLVLNASYEPLNVCTVRRAHVLVYKGKAEGVERLRQPPRPPPRRLLSPPPDPPFPHPRPAPAGPPQNSPPAALPPHPPPAPGPLRAP